ncbi:MAG: hypothetical protein Q8858_06385 [Bacteroidota bacterium]|nr:hypothetical protein [Bacteroidota bacterium]
MNKTYFKLPYFLQFFVVNAFGLSIRFKRYNKAFAKALDEYIQLDRVENCKLNIDKIIEVTKDSKFYSINNEQDFFGSPILDKAAVKKYYDKIINHKYVYNYFHTSGTTGSGLKFPVSKDFLARQWAIFWKFRRIHNISTTTWCAYMIGKNILDPDRRNPPYWIKSYPTYQLLFSVSHLNKETIEQYLTKIKESKIYWMHGYPSTLTYIASLIKEAKLESLAKELNLKIITTSSETLYDFQKRNVEQIFGCCVRQLYGLTEGVANIFECEHGSLHIDESFSYVEFVREENSCEDYKIIGSTYLNKAFPLIRYDTGDTVKLFEENFKCPCGRKSRVVKEIIGREQDYLILFDGTKVGGSGFFFKKLVHVNRAQIYQRRKGEAIFFLVKAPGFTEEEEQLLVEEITNKLGKNFKYEIRYTNDLIKLKNGKTKFVINEIETGCNLSNNQFLSNNIKKEKQEPNSDITNGNVWKEGIQVLALFLFKYIIFFSVHLERFLNSSV